MNRAGRKLCITGKGRCNLTNIADLNDFLDHFGRTGKFLRQAFSRFFTPDLIDFFEELGLELVTERGGRVFPASGNAPDVLAVFLEWLKRCRVSIKCSTAVTELVVREGRVTGVVSRGRQFHCDGVILATGGASYPATGSTGDGYKLAEYAGHSIVPVRPALVPLETTGELAGRMDGLSLRNVRVRMLTGGRKRKEAFGEMAFSASGVTGPVILMLSGEVVDALREGRKVVLSIDLKPALDDKKLDARLLRDFSSRGKEEFSSILRGLIPREMVPVCVDITGVPHDRRGSSITALDRKRLRTWIKDFRLEVTGHRPFEEAIITAGGVSTKEINPRTMESHKTSGLFISGELLDIHADTGGYNLQSAFSTGWLAGRSAARGTGKTGTREK
jgi:predicted Rossmann fold flavoprotein